MVTAPPVRPVRRRLSSQGRREQLVDVATQLFSQFGFTGTTTREIATAAGVTEPVIFQHFPHKDELYAAILERKSEEARTDEWVAKLRAAAISQDDEAVVRAAVEHIVDYQRHDPAFVRLMLHSALEDHELARKFHERHVNPIREFLVEYVTAAQRAGRIRKLDPQTIVFVMLALPMQHSLARTLHSVLRAPSSRDVAGTYVSIILDGIRTTSAPERTRAGTRHTSRRAATGSRKRRLSHKARLTT